MANNVSFGPFGPVAEFIIVALGALGVATMFQDYAYFYRPAAISLENVILKYGAVFFATLVHTILIRQRRKAARKKP